MRAWPAMHRNHATRTVLVASSTLVLRANSKQKRSKNAETRQGLQASRLSHAEGLNPGAPVRRTGALPACPEAPHLLREREFVNLFNIVERRFTKHKSASRLRQEGRLPFLITNRPRQGASAPCPYSGEGDGDRARTMSMVSASAADLSSR